MNKRIISRCGSFIFTLLLAVAAVQGQGINSYRAHVPFDFVVGNETHEAGDYLIRLEQQNALATIIRLCNAEGRELQAAAVMKNGKTSNSNRTLMIFNRYGDNYILRQISSPTFGFWAPKADTATWVTITKDLRKKPKTVSVTMRK